jgi:hypothetical protein
MKTLYERGDHVRLRSITSEMPAVVLEDEGREEPLDFGRSCVVVRVALYDGRVERDVPRRMILGRAP